MEEIKKINTDEKSLAEIARFLSESFPRTTKFTKEFIKWQYTQNPLGSMQGFNACHNGKIVSHFAALPIDMILWEKKHKGLLCINVSTNATHRGNKLFSKLGQATIDDAAQNGYDFMIAVPNANSTHAFLKYFGFYLISPLTAKVGIGKNIFSGHRPFNCFKSWDNEQWQWRLQNPANKYWLNDKIISTPISFFAQTISAAHLPNELTIDRTENTGLRPLNLYVGLGADTSKGTYFSIPSFVKRPPFNLVFKDLTGNLPIINKDDIFIQLIDLDTI